VAKSLPLDSSLFEKIIIYNALIDPVYLESVIPHIRPSFFENSNIKIVFEALNNFYQTYNKVPNTTELKLHLTDADQRQALKQVALSFSDIDKTYDKEVLIINTEKFLREKAVYNTVLKTSVDVQSGQIDTSKILTEFQNACNINLVENYGFDYLESIDKHCEELQKVFKVIPSGWKWLDDRIGGGFLAEGRALYVFYGVTNVGKSIFLGNIATNILSQNKTVVLISLEMSEQVYAKRISSQLSRIPMNDLSMQIEPLKQEINTYKLKYQDAKLIIKEFPPKTVSPLQIKAYIEKLTRKGIKPDAIVLDYLNLLAPVDKGMNSYEAIKQITELVRSLSYYFNCPVISATQANRSAYDQNNPGLETVSESMGLAHTADAQFSIWTEEEDFELGLIHMGITKNRFGPRQCHTVLEIDYPTLSLRDPDDVSKSFTVNRKNIPGDQQNISATLNAIESLDEKG
jgi:replicative DNA helicase